MEDGNVLYTFELLGCVPPVFAGSWRACVVELVAKLLVMSVPEHFLYVLLVVANVTV